jgi:alpha-L-fucosidase
MRKAGWVLAALMVMTLVPACAQQTTGAPAEDLRWFKESRFGMFIHWGIYSILGRGEWVMFQEKIPVETYEKMQAEFDPTLFDAEKVVALAKAAGQKYITITSKHHDGFCMFDSKLTTYSSMHSPAHRDFIGELTKACQKNGVGIFYYYSLLDWHHPDYKGNFPKYLDYAFGQVRELCTNYGKINGIWFDGGWEHSAADWKAEELIGMIRKLQPHALVNDRANWDGDFGTPEQTIPGGRVGPGQRLFECCFTVNNNWGYNAGDLGFKSPQRIVQMVSDIVGRGGNLLLNIGPKPTGEVDDRQAWRLRNVGEWMKANGESIYGCDGGPFTVTPWGACTSKGNRLYLHFWEWPGAGEYVVKGLKTKVKSAYVLKGKVPVKARPVETGMALMLPEIAPDLLDTVVVVDLAGPAEVEYAVEAAADGTLTLAADLAEVHGNRLQVESKPDPDGSQHPNLGFWVEAGDWASWRMRTERAGKYQVSLSTACQAGGSEIEIALGAEKLAFTVPTTKDWADFKVVDVGTVELPKGALDASVRCKEMKNGAVMNLRWIRLKPVE